MALSIGIVGLPNVGKSTLFQAITKKQVDRANYPFCTIDPNVGVVAVPDERVEKLAELEKSQKKIFTAIEFTDIAGLVKGASHGEGLGNKFLANIRETDAVVYVLRAFQNKEIINTQEKIDPWSEKGILETELILKDLETINKRLESLQKEIRAGKKEALKENEVLTKAKSFLNGGKILADLTAQNFSEEDLLILKSYQLLTLKPRIFLLNGEKDEMSPEITKEFENRGLAFLIFSVAKEFDAAGLNTKERLEFGYEEESGLNNLIKKSYELLGLITFFTTGSDETRAWTIKKGDKAPRAGGAIHSDFEKNFIRAEIINWKNLLDCGGYAKAREKGLLRTEGKEYVVVDGDVIEIKHS